MHIPVVFRILPLRPGQRKLERPPGQPCAACEPRLGHAGNHFRVHGGGYRHPTAVYVMEGVMHTRIKRNLTQTTSCAHSWTVLGCRCPGLKLCHPLQAWNIASANLTHKGCINNRTVANRSFPRSQLWLSMEDNLWERSNSPSDAKNRRNRCVPAPQPCLRADAHGVVPNVEQSPYAHHPSLQ